MALLTYDQIKNKVGQTWALLSDPEFSDKSGQLVRAELVYFNKDKKKVYKESEKCKSKHICFLYFGEIFKDQVYILYVQ